MAKGDPIMRGSRSVRAAAIATLRHSITLVLVSACTQATTKQSDMQSFITFLILQTKKNDQKVEYTEAPRSSERNPANRDVTARNTVGNSTPLLTRYSQHSQYDATSVEPSDEGKGQENIELQVNSVPLTLKDIGKREPVNVACDLLKRYLVDQTVYGDACIRSQMRYINIIATPMETLQQIPNKEGVQGLDYTPKCCIKISFWGFSALGEWFPMILRQKPQVNLAVRVSFEKEQLPQKFSMYKIDTSAQVPTVFFRPTSLNLHKGKESASFIEYERKTPKLGLAASILNATCSEIASWTSLVKHKDKNPRVHPTKNVPDTAHSKNLKIEVASLMFLSKGKDDVLGEILIKPGATAPDAVYTTCTTTKHCSPQKAS